MLLLLNKLAGIGTPGLQKLSHPVAIAAGIEMDILRLDAIHPVISGNKWFKLKGHLAQAIEEKKKGILTYGGAWSNHIVATAYSCHALNLASIGYIRGEKPAVPSTSLMDAEKYGMKLIFVPRNEYPLMSGSEMPVKEFPEYLVVPEGGKTSTGIRGAAGIPGLFNAGAYDHIACAMGTGTTMAGLLLASEGKHRIIGISAIKTSNVNDNEITRFISQWDPYGMATISFDYHFGGYAKKNPVLLQFMNEFHHSYHIPTDFVYTARLFYGILDLAAKGFFPRGSRICLIHSGGLQGNRSLSPSQIRF